MRLTCFLLLSATVACSASSATFKSGGTNAGGGEGGTSTVDVVSVGAGGFDPQATSTGSGGEPQASEVYGHSDTTLYRFDPTTKQVAVVGPFTNCSSVIDIAIDASSNVFATTFGGLYRIDKKSAVCSLVAKGNYPNSLSFVPEGTLLPNAEALVGYNGSSYVRIDTLTGAVTPVGNLGAGYESSGDVVSVKGGGTYLTVKGSGCGDCLVEVDPKTGKMTKNWGAVGFGSVFGLAYWAGSAYGFADSGDLFEIQFGATTVNSVKLPVANAPIGLSFWGAGSTTIAPVDKPL